MIYLIHHAIDNSAKLFPEQEAFRFENKSLTYQKLVEQANSLAHLLIDQGLKKGDRIGVYCNKSLESAVAIYGIMKAGGAYVPLDPSAPATRIRFILNNCQIRGLITQPQKQSYLAEILQETTSLDYVIGLPENSELPIRIFDWKTVTEISAKSSPNVKIIEQDLAYIMYTSGSTGEPKGIMHTHQSGLTYAKMSAHLYNLNKGDRLGNHSPLHFDMSTLDYFTGPLVGATTVIIPEAYTKIPASLSQLIEIEKLTIWYSVPFALIQLLHRGLLPDHDLSSLRWILFGGEPFPPKYLYELMTLLPQARFCNVYGPAEINQCSYYHIPPLESIPDEPVPIGKIWDNAEELVVDQEDKPITQGEIGELLVRTPTMMQGYWQNPDLNKKAFFYRNRTGNHQDIFYRTGDLVQLEPDGNYRFLGRKDRQIKTRGYRVELDEIETALVSHPFVEEAGVFGVQDSEGSQHIEAAITLKGQQQITPIELIRYASNILPRYAIPLKISIREELPRTTSGKIDRRALQQEAMRNLNELPGSK
ncbi:MAG: amino acid adenylation domain-containing protein [Crocosphaera sp.]|nr:amino acid adenylation domain-containing protein [Crocosphaera sp.]